MTWLGERRGTLLLLIPYLVGLGLLVIVPALATGWLAFFEWDLVRSPRFIGLENFRELLSDDVFAAAVGNSLSFIALAVPLRLAAATGLALLLHARIHGRGTYRTSALIPTLIPDVAYALVWLWIFNPLYGPMNVALTAMGIAPVDWLTDPEAARWALVILSVFTVGEGFLVALAARNQVPGELYELASVEDAGPLNRVRRITLPLMGPALLLLAFRDVVFSLQGTFVASLVVTGGGPPPYATTYMPLFVYREGFEYLRYGYAAAATLSMLVLTAAIIAAQYAVVRRWRRALLVPRV